MIEVRNLWYRYSASDQWVLQDASFTIEEGVVGLIGPNGSGKTTLLRLITRFLKQKKGQVKINGTVYKKPRELTGKVAYVPTDPLTMLTGPTVEQDVQKAARNRESNPANVLSFFGIEQLRHRKIYKLSQGEQKLLALAASYAMKPEILLLDEPTIGLDREKRSILLKTIQKKAKDGTVIVATNDMRIATKLPRLLVLSNGKIVANGKTREILYELKDEWGLLPNEIVEFAKRIQGKGVAVGNPTTPQELAKTLEEWF